MKLKQSIIAKTAAIILCVITMFVTISSVFAVYIMVETGFYVNSAERVKLEALESSCNEYALRCVSLYRFGEEPDIGTFLKYKNFFCEIYDKDDKGKLLYGNYNNEQYQYKTESEVCFDDEEYLVKCYIPLEFEYTDDISIQCYWIDIGSQWKYGIIAVGAVSLIANILLFVFLMCAAGHRCDSEGKDTVCLWFIDHIPYDLFVSVLAFSVWAIICLVDLFTEAGIVEAAIAVGAAIILTDLIFICLCMSTATRIKTGVLINGTLIYKIIRTAILIVKKIWKGISAFFGNLPTLWKSVIGMLCFFLANLFFFALILESNGLALLLWIAVWVFAFAVMCRLSLNLKKLGNAVSKIAAGDFDSRIDTGKMRGDFKKQADELNNISGSLSLALNEKLKSERFKTELITNVSHDLKTPLTSIINYVDLIKKEDTDNPKIKEYTEVLERQSARLKKLTVDLVEASKASTGNVSVNFAPCDLCELLSQITGEYKERLESKGLKLVTEMPDSPVVINGDGRHLWRIIDNLMNNILKYTMSGTRVYLDLEKDDKRAWVIFRNISNYPLNIPGDELMERFVRGDVSRHSEGSGLGLSIARSLTELLKGTMSVNVDGDLFKATITFDLLN